MAHFPKIVYVGNLNFATNEQDLYTHFEKYGDISKIEIFRDSNGQKDLAL